MHMTQEGEKEGVTVREQEEWKRKREKFIWAMSL